MTNTLDNLLRSSKRVTRNPLGILSLFLLLIYAIAGLVITTSFDLDPTDRRMMTWFLVLFPVLVLFVFAWLVSNHSTKLYGPADYRSDENFLRMQMATIASLSAAVTRRSVELPSSAEVEAMIDSIQLAVQSPTTQKQPWRAKILWVDDRPTNNVLERMAFESIGLRVKPVITTSAAIAALQDERFDAVISDMNRDGDENAGITLLQELRERGEHVPYFIFSISITDEKGRIAVSLGAHAYTHEPQELFLLVTRATMKRTGESG